MFFSRLSMQFPISVGVNKAVGFDIFLVLFHFFNVGQNMPIF
jgi:hypothetical protein